MRRSFFLWICLSVWLTLSLFAAITYAFEPSFTDEERSKLDNRLKEISEAEGRKRSEDEIWVDFKKQLLEPEAQKPGLNFQPHKLNYFVTNGLPGDPAAQIKFQISAKFRVFEGNFNYLENNVFPLYFAYTQRSFWDIGKPSAPFGENNYNPELFLDYPVSENRFKLNHVVLSGEHESNGRDGVESRSWNRLYVLFSFGIESKDGLEKKGVLRKEKYSGSLKLWQAYGYEDQDDYLSSIGKNEKFLDYAGRGEVSFSIREVPIISLCPWLKNNQLDFKTRMFRDWDKGSYEIGYNQKIPSTDFFVYIQYWDGFGESLQRFDKWDTKWKAGLSFFY